MLNHEPGWTDAGDDEVWYRANDLSYADVGMSFDKSVGQCSTMEQSDSVHENEMQSKSCGENAAFACTFSCSGLYCIH